MSQRRRRRQPKSSNKSRQLQDDFVVDEDSDMSSSSSSGSSSSSSSDDDMRVEPVNNRGAASPSDSGSSISGTDSESESSTEAESDDESDSQAKISLKPQTAAGMPDTSSRYYDEDAAIAKQFQDMSSSSSDDSDGAGGDDNLNAIDRERTSNDPDMRGFYDEDPDSVPFLHLLYEQGAKDIDWYVCLFVLCSTDSDSESSIVVLSSYDQNQHISPIIELTSFSFLLSPFSFLSFFFFFFLLFPSPFPLKYVHLNTTTRELGMLEIKRLLCALRFLVELKDVESEIVKAGLDQEPYSGHALVSTLASGSESVSQFHRKRDKMQKQYLHERRKQERLIKASEKLTEQGALHSAHMVKSLDEKMHLDYTNTEEIDKLKAARRICPDDEFELFVSHEIRTREAHAYEDIWHEWEAKNERERALREVDEFYTNNPDAFDPDPIVSDYEQKSYRELIRFLFTRAMDDPTGPSVLTTAHFLAKGMSAEEATEAAVAAEAERKRAEDEEEAGLTQAQIRTRRRQRTIRGVRQKLNTYFISRIQSVLLKLRRAETNPKPFRDTGNEFFNKIDNYLAVLLYRRQAPHRELPGPSFFEANAGKREEEDEKRLAMEQELLQRQEAKRIDRVMFWRGLVHESFDETATEDQRQFAKVGVPRQSGKELDAIQRIVPDKELDRRNCLLRVKFFGFGLLLTAVVCLSAFGLWGIWSFTATKSLQSVADKLSSEIELTVQRQLSDQSISAIQAGRAMSQAFGLGLLNQTVLHYSYPKSIAQADPQVADADRMFSEVVQRLNVSGMYFALGDGSYFGAFVGDRLAEPQGVYTFVPYVRVFEDLGKSKPCMVQYEVDRATSSRMWNTSTILYCLDAKNSTFGFPTFGGPSDAPTAQQWYTRAPVMNYSLSSDNGTIIDPSNFPVDGTEAASLFQLAGEGWSDLHALSPVQLGITFSTPVYRANSSSFTISDAAKSLNTTIDLGSIVLQHIGAIAVDVSVDRISARLAEVAVGRTGASYIGSAKTTTSFDYVTGSQGSTDYIVSISRQYLEAQISTAGSLSALNEVRPTRDCSNADSASTTSRFSDAELNDITEIPISDFDGNQFIVAVRNLSLVLTDLPEHLRYLPDWVVVSTFPTDDYFADIRDNEHNTLILGAAAVFCGFVLLYYSYSIIPDVNKLKQHMEDRRKRRVAMKKKRRIPMGRSASTMEMTGLRRQQSNPGLASTSAESRQSFMQVLQRNSTLDLTRMQTVVGEDDARNRGMFSELFSDDKRSVRVTIGFMTVLVVLTFASIAFVWSSSSTLAVNTMADDLIAETQNHLVQNAERIADRPRRVNTFSEQQYARSSRSDSAFSQRFATVAQLPGNPALPSVSAPATVFFPATPIGTNGSRPVFSYDAYFTALMKTFREPNGQYSVTNIYVGFTNGDYVGAEVRSDDTDKIQIAAKDASNGRCFRKYAINSDGTRNPSQVLFESGGCAFDHRSRIWYQTAVSDFQRLGKRTVGWTAIYLVSGTERLGLTTFVPLFDANNNLVAVLGADLNLESLSDFLEVSQLSSSCGSRFFIVQRDGDLVASSDKQVTQTFGDAVDDSGNKVVFLLNSTDSSDDTISTTAQFLVKRSGGLSIFETQEVIERPLEAPITGVQVIRVDYNASQPDSGIDWIVIVALPFDVFLGQFDDFVTLSFLLSVATILLIVGMVGVSFQLFQDRLVINERKRLRELGTTQSSKKRRRHETHEAWELRSLTELMREIRPTIQQAAAYRLNRKTKQAGLDYNAIAVEDVRYYVAEEGLRHIVNAQKGRDVLTLCALEERDTSIPRRLYKLHTSKAYTNFIHIVVVLHIGLSLFEPDTFDQLRADGPNRVAGVFELVFLCIETLDAILTYFITIKWRRESNMYDMHSNSDSNAQAAQAAQASKTSANLRAAIRQRFGVHISKDMMLDFVYAGIVFIVWIDWIAKQLFSFSFQYFYPFRPFLIVLRSKSIRLTTGSFLVTLYEARDIFFLYMVTIVVAAAFGTILFRNTLTSLIASGPQSSYANFVRSVITTFVYISTGDNYPDLVYPAFDISPLFMVYFLVFLVFGMFFILAMVIGRFQIGFVTMSREKRLREKLSDRTGIVAAFILLDFDSSEQLSWPELENLTEALRNLIGDDDPQLIATWDKLHQVHELNNNQGGAVTAINADFLASTGGNGSSRSLNATTPAASSRSLAGGHARSRSRSRSRSRRGSFDADAKIDASQDEHAKIAAEVYRRNQRSYHDEFYDVDPTAPSVGMSILQFVTVIESIRWERSLYQKDVNSISKCRQVLQIRVYEQRWYQYLLVALTMIHLVVIALFGTVPTERENALEWTAMSLFFVHWIEIGLRIYTYGFREFWFYGKFHHGSENRYQQTSHRFDTVLLIVCVLGFGVAWSLAEGNISFATDNDKLRFTIVTTLPILRIFHLIRRLRRLFFTLVRILPKFVDLFTLLSVIFLVYGILGVYLFAGKFNELLQDDAPPGNFDSLSNALQSLFQMLVGEAWADLMYAGILVTRDFVAAWYFISFICIATLLFVNIFIGLVLESFQVYLAEVEAEKLRQKALRRSRYLQQEAGDIDDALTGVADEPAPLSRRESSRHTLGARTGTGIS
jgi:Ion transport protein/Methyl-accepting chemotaxis protein-like, first PDC sensor domain